MDQIDTKYKASLPKTLLNRLLRVSNNNAKIPFQLFRGLINSKIYCFVISFLQLFLHCPEVIKYINTNNVLNDTETLLKEIIQKIYLKNNNQGVSIENFIQNWKHWDNGQNIPCEQRDVTEFADYFFASLSDNLSDFFGFIKIDEDEKFMIPYKSFILNCLSNKDDIQQNVDDRISECYNIDNFNKYFFISLQRNFNKRRKKIKINTFIQIKSNVYKFVGAVVYKGNGNCGHFTTVMKICGQFFLFNDENVYSLFTCSKSPNFTTYLMELYEKNLHTNSTLFLYKRCNETCDFNLYESIINNQYFHLSLQQLTPEILMFQTMKIIQDESNENKKISEQEKIINSSFENSNDDDSNDVKEISDDSEKKLDHPLKIQMIVKPIYSIKIQVMNFYIFVINLLIHLDHLLLCFLHQMKNIN